MRLMLLYWQTSVNDEVRITITTVLNGLCADSGPVTTTAEQCLEWDGDADASPHEFRRGAGICEQSVGLDRNGLCID